MKIRFLIILLANLLFIFSSAQQLTIEAFGPSFNKPVNIKQAGDDRLFIVEQDGFIQILNADGTKNATPFLNIDSKVITVTGIGDERGFLGLAFHPDYITNGFFYLNYIDNSGNTTISRFTRSNSNAADSNSELILLTITQPASNHNGGDLAFGTDGYLYIASGDGGGAGDPSNNAQNLSTLLGKLLRIDVDNPDVGLNYGIPANNPFNNGDVNTLPEIWAYGLRNPWKFSFDRDTDDLWIADVGQSNKEEINMVASTDSGLNYGWRCYEGNAIFDTTGCPDQSTLTFPVSEYNYGGSPFRCAITGGYRYRGNAFPNFNGLYFFADYCSNEIGYLTQNGTNWDSTFITPTTPSGNDSWVAFGEDFNGELYIAGIVTGKIYKLIDETLNTESFEISTFKLQPNPAKSHFYIQLNSTSINGSINIYNILGKKVKSLKINKTKTKIETTNLTRGIYLVELIDYSGKKQTKKLIIN